MTNFIVKKVAVLGAGVMGAQIAAHCINAKVPVVLFDLPAKEGPKNGIVLRAIENLKKLSPAPLGNKDDASLIQVANYEDNLDLLAGCDLIIEAIAERMDWKHDLYQKVAPHIGPNAIFASNTSGLSITKLAEGFDADLKSRYCGVHFFNPPRYMHLVEIIPTESTRPEIADQLEGFLTTTLGKGVVRAKDTPNFIANRVGVFGILAIVHEAEKFGLSVDVVDDLTGSKWAAPSRAPSARRTWLAWTPWAMSSRPCRTTCRTILSLPSTRRRPCWRSWWKKARWARRAARASTRKSARRFNASISPPVNTSLAAPRLPTSSPAS
jgi:3-hydroxyacyl-CoA dehydrogenase